MNGVAVLPFSFPASQSEDLRVYSYDTINGIQTLLTEVTDYTIAFTDATLPSAGSVTLLSSVLYNDTNFQVTLTRFTGQVNEYDMEFGQRMNPEQLEFEQDRQVQMIQDIAQGLSEAVVFPTSEEVAPGANVLPTVALRKNGILGFDANGDFTTSTTILDDAVADATAASAASAAAALVSEGNASTSESNAATSESNASTSATNAGISETNAAASAESLPTFEAPADGKIAIGNVAGTEFENSLYTIPKTAPVGDVGKVATVSAENVVTFESPSGVKGRLVKFLTTSGSLTINELADDSLAAYLTSNEIKSGTYLVLAHGAGGGGGGSNPNFACGGGGGGGASRDIITISSTTVYTIGAGGSGGVGYNGSYNDGVTGGSTTLLTVTSGGGGGGEGGNGSSAGFNYMGGVGGTGSLYNGAPGQSGFNALGFDNGANGGGKSGGRGGSGESTGTAGENGGLASGGGGGGGGSSNNDAGDGGDGYIEIYEWEA